MIGRNPVLEALQAGLPVRRAYVADGVERDDRLRDIFKYAADNGIPLLQATRTELDRMTGGGVHQGVALQLPPFEYADADDVLADALESDTAPIVVACDSITDPRNLGAIIRSAAAFGASGVIIPERRSAQLTAAAWKTSAGAAARIPVAQVTNLNRALKRFADAGFHGGRPGRRSRNRRGRIPRHRRTGAGGHRLGGRGPGPAGQGELRCTGLDSDRLNG